jgi:hypothetical protein
VPQNCIFPSICHERAGARSHRLFTLTEHFVHNIFLHIPIFSTICRISWAINCKSHSMQKYETWHLRTALLKLDVMAHCAMQPARRIAMFHCAVNVLKDRSLRYIAVTVRFNPFRNEVWNCSCRPKGRRSPRHLQAWRRSSHRIRFVAMANGEK